MTPAAELKSLAVNAAAPLVAPSARASAIEIAGVVPPLLAIGELPLTDETLAANMAKLTELRYPSATALELGIEIVSSARLKGAVNVRAASFAANEAKSPLDKYPSIAAVAWAMANVRSTVRLPPPVRGAVVLI